MGELCGLTSFQVDRGRAEDSAKPFSGIHSETLLTDAMARPRAKKRKDRVRVEYSFLNSYPLGWLFLRVKVICWWCCVEPCGERSRMRSAMSRCIGEMEVAPMWDASTSAT